MWYLDKIPKVLHLYFGAERLSYLRYLTPWSFAKYNPDWKIKFYIPKYYYKTEDYTSPPSEICTRNYKGKDYFSKLLKIKNLDIIQFDLEKIGFTNDISETFKSDFIRWYLLGKHGGLWSDMDVIYFRSMNEWHQNNEHNRNIDTCVSISPNGIYHSIGFNLSSENNVFYNKVYEMAKTKLNKNDFQSIGSCLLSQNFLPINKIKQLGANVLNIEMHTVYLIDSFNIPQIFQQDHSQRYFDNNGIAIHYYAGHALAHKYHNALTEDNYKEFNHTLGKIVNYILEN